MAAPSTAPLPPLRLGVLGSGKGSNFRAIVEAIEAGTVRAEVAIVISDMEHAGILEIARHHGIRAEYVAPGPFRTKMAPESEQRLLTLLLEARLDYVVLAGYMRMIKAPLLEAFPRRIINIHPSLLPAFPGLEAWAQAHAAKVPSTGCTVHYVDAGMDTGEVIAQREVPVLPTDTEASLHARIQVAEHQLYPEVIAQLEAERHQAQVH
jgi:phosphoribosylglycinamide formyltransferase-1